MKDQSGVNPYEELYKKELQEFEKRISGFFAGRKPASLYDPCSYIMQGGGKRIRPFLVLISARSVGGKFKEAYNAAMAVELLHNFTLAHDDIMDNADIRRGRPTVHKKYDISTAILAGDNLVALAYESLLKDSHKNVHQVISVFTHGIIEVCEGQSLDKEFEIRKNVSLAEYKTMIYKKTAALAETCCAVGAYVGGGTKKQIAGLRDYGKYLGMAFQIQDDLLDITADQSKFGKKIGGDLIEGKKTYLFLKALELAKGKDKTMLLNVVKNKGIAESEVPAYRDLYMKLGVIDKARKEILNYTNKALKSVSGNSLREGQEILTWLAYTLINRSR